MVSLCCIITRINLYLNSFQEKSCDCSTFLVFAYTAIADEFLVGLLLSYRKIAFGFTADGILKENHLAHNSEIIIKIDKLVVLRNDIKGFA